jgi:hypothetical protein
MGPQTFPPRVPPPRRSEPKHEGLEQPDFDFDIDADTTVDVFVIASPSDLPFSLEEAEAEEAAPSSVPPSPVVRPRSS